MFYRKAHPAAFVNLEKILKDNAFIGTCLEIFGFSRDRLNKIQEVAFPLLGLAADREGLADVSLDPACVLNGLAPQQNQHRYNCYVLGGTSSRARFPSWKGVEKLIAELPSGSEWNEFYDRVIALSKEDEATFSGLQNLALTLLQLELQVAFLCEKVKAEKGRTVMGGDDLRKDVTAVGVVIVADPVVSSYPSDALSQILDSPLGLSLPHLCEMHAKERMLLSQGKQNLLG